MFLWGIGIAFFIVFSIVVFRFLASRHRRNCVTVGLGGSTWPDETDSVTVKLDEIHKFIREIESKRREGSDIVGIAVNPHKGMSVEEFFEKHGVKVNRCGILNYIDGSGLPVFCCRYLEEGHWLPIPGWKNDDFLSKPIRIKSDFKPSFDDLWRVNLPPRIGT